MLGTEGLLGWGSCLRYSQNQILGFFVDQAFVLFVVLKHTMLLKRKI